MERVTATVVLLVWADRGLGYQPPHHVRMSPPCSQQQGRVAFDVVVLISACALFQHQALHLIQATFQGGEKNFGVTHLPLPCATVMANQPPYDVCLALKQRRIHRSVSTVLRSHTCTGLCDQPLHRVGVPLACSQHERCFLSVVLPLDLSATGCLAHQPPHHVKMSALRGEMERRVAIAVSGFEAGISLVHQPLHLVQKAVFCRKQQRFVGVWWLRMGGKSGGGRSGGAFDRAIFLVLLVTWARAVAITCGGLTRSLALVVGATRHSALTTGIATAKTVGCGTLSTHRVKVIRRASGPPTIKRLC
eukprot:m.450585 g.450585  ORF g.450585 m.450585 type:complete len:305 (+) comp20321_c0_seq15:340-1254(+)